MTLIEDDFIERNKKKVFEKAEYFVISVGTSYEPIVLNIRLTYSSSMSEQTTIFRISESQIPDQKHCSILIIPSQYLETLK